MATPITPDKIVNHVSTSMDYQKFSFIDSNREISVPHVEELKESMLTHPLEKPIDVNEKFQIIDGQHRFMAWWELNMPILYIVHEGWGAKEVPILNSNQKNWKPSDFVRMYVDLGKDAYVKYKEFSERYGFTHTANIMLLRGGFTAEKRTTEFNSGNFEVKKWNWANIIAKNIIELKDYYPGYKRASFVAAYIRMSMDKNFDHQRLMDKILYQQRKLVDCTTTAQYYELLVEIYNYRTNSAERVKIEQE